MSTVRIQYPTEDRRTLLAHWRAAFGIPSDYSEEALFEQFLDDLVASLAWAMARHIERLGELPPSGEWMFVESTRASEQVPRKALGYEVLLQAWDSGLPWEYDDVAREVRDSPAWLRRVMVVVWRGLA